MNYSTYGIIGFALLFGMAFTIFSTKNVESQEFVKTLDKKQLEIYKSIVEFRFNLFLQYVSQARLDVRLHKESETS